MMFNKTQYRNALVYVHNKLQGKAGAEQVDGIVHGAEMHFYGGEHAKNYTHEIRSDVRDEQGNSITFTAQQIKDAAEL